MNPYATTQKDGFPFKGDQQEQNAVAKVAVALGIKIFFDSQYYVQTKEEYKKVVEYLIDNKVDGYRLYK